MAAPMINILTANFTRLAVTARTAPSTLQLNRCLKTQAHPLLFLTTDRLEKKGASQGFSLQKRMVRKKKTLQKHLAKMDRKSVALKAPIKELIIDSKLKREAVTIRKREHSSPPEEREKEKTKFTTEWQRYCVNFHTQNIHLIQRRLSSQQRALKELRMESEDLYQQAIALDENLYNFTVKRLTDTPAIPGFQPIDGEYNDVTIKYD